MRPQLGKGLPSGMRKSRSSDGEMIPINISPLKARGIRKAVLSNHNLPCSEVGISSLFGVSLESRGSEDKEGYMEFLGSLLFLIQRYTS
jgi:hypothetical protein